jgi:hypothetical protein
MEIYGILPGNTDFWQSMQVLRLLSRVAFICNICFLLASFIQWLPYKVEGGAVSLIIILGYLLAIIVNVVVNVSVMLLFLLRKLRTSPIPVWLVIVNFCFFLLQITLFIINRK